MIKLKKIYNIIKLNEGTSNYYPGYSDDATSDELSAIREKTSPIVNTELRNMESDIMNRSSGGVYNPEDDKFWQTWMYANLICTCLQDNFYIDGDLIKKAIKNYKTVLSHPNRKNFTGDSDSTFVKQVSETLNELNKLNPLDDNRGYYAPWFMSPSSRTINNTKKDL